MKLILIIGAVAVFAAALILTTAFICFRMAFYSKKRVPSSEIHLPSGEAYVPYHDVIRAYVLEMRSLPCREFEITSFDGLKLYARYYEQRAGAPIELMFHGYRSSAERDLCGGIRRCFEIGHNAFIVDQRACGKSEGSVIGFGITECRDCLDWVDLIVREFGSDISIILTGISMGAATVLTASGEPLPDNVIGVLADCGYTSAKDIICKVIRDMKLPPRLLYPFVKLGAKIYGGFDLEQKSPITALQKCTLPVIFFHGEADGFVPCYMSEQNYEVCKSTKKLVTYEGVDHGLCYLAKPQEYLKTARDFFEPVENKIK